MWQLLTASFATGLAAGPACVLHCGAFQLAYMARCAAPGRAATVRLGALVLVGRFTAYMALGLLVGLAAGSGLFLPSPWLLSAAVAGLMLCLAVWPRSTGDCACNHRAGATVGGALFVGFITGMAPCPPLLASGVLAFKSGGPLAAICTFTAFFAGSSILLVPAVFGLSVIPPSTRPVVKRAGRILAGIVAVYAIAGAMKQFPRADLAAGGGGNPFPGSRRLPGATGLVPAPAAVIRPPSVAPDTVTPLFRKKRLKGLLTRSLITKYGLSLHEAKHYRRLDAGRVQCQLCPRECLLKEGERGICRVRANIGGVLRALTYARPVTVHGDPIEKKPLYHVLPGSTALSLATVGCNSGCVFCQNYEISQASPEDVRRMRVPPERLVQAAVARGDAGIAYTYTEPTVFFEYMLETATLAKARGLRNYWITCGQIRQEPLLELCKVLDAANVDLKGFSDEFYVRYCDFHLAPVLETLKTLHREGVMVEVTNLIIPGANDDDDMIRDMCLWIKQELGPDTPLHFSRFHPDYKLRRRPPTSAATLLRARTIAREAGLHYVYIGNIRTEHAGDTLCPKCGKIVLSRTGFVVVGNDLHKGRCPHCDTRIAGIWK